MVENKLISQITGSKKYAKWREEVLIIGDGKCAECGIWGGCIQTHHKKKLLDIVEEKKITSIEEALECKELWDVNNGQCLCSHHHINLHIKLKKLDKRHK